MDGEVGKKWRAFIDNPFISIMTLQPAGSILEAVLFFLLLRRFVFFQIVHLSLSFLFWETFRAEEGGEVLPTLSLSERAAMKKISMLGQLFFIRRIPPHPPPPLQHTKECTFFLVGTVEC